FHGAATLIEDFSDGVQAFTGLITAVLSLPHRVLLVDEPDAFLHPPLARRLGQDMTNVAGEREGTLIAATHSADFLMGCLESTADASLVRLTYDGGVATARALAPDRVAALVKDPLLRSTDALDGLFHKSVV